MRLPVRHLLSSASSLLLHLLAGLGIAWLASSGQQRPAATGQSSRAMSVFVVPPAEDPRFPGLNSIGTSQDDSLIRRVGESSALSIPGFTFDFTKIADRATLLFPFLTPGLSLEHFALAPRRDVSERLQFSFTSAQVPQSKAVRRTPPLMLSDTAMQALVDKSWSRRDRWDAFQQMVTLVNTHDPNLGKLPALLRAYLEQDGLQPYADSTNRDSRLWTELGLAAAHVDFVGFISRYASEHPSTKATTELLFLLDNLVQASFDVLATLLDIDPSEDLRWTRDANREAYDLIADLRRYYNTELEHRHLTSAEALKSYYDGIRLGILTGVLRTTPQEYRAGDARFLIGTIYWRERKVADALESWREMTIDPTDSYVTASSNILAAIRDQTGRDGPTLDTKRIDRILDREHGRWISFSADRLHKFGYHFDTF